MSLVKFEYKKAGFIEYDVGWWPLSQPVGGLLDGVRLCLDAYLNNFENPSRVAYEPHLVAMVVDASRELRVFLRVEEYSREQIVDQ